MLPTEKIVFIGTKEIKYIIPEKYLLNYKELDKTWAHEYKFENNNITQKKIYKTKQKLFKCFFKTVELRYNLVQNDILAKEYNGIKTFITRNTGMFYASKQKVISKPLSVFKIQDKRLQGLLPKLSDYYNVTGDTVSFNIYQFTHHNLSTFVHNLKSYVLAKIYLHKNFYACLKTKISTYNKNIFSSQTQRRRKFNFRLGGLRLKFLKVFKHIKFKAIRLASSRLRKTKSFRTIRKVHKFCLKSFHLLYLSTLKQKTFSRQYFINAQLVI